MNSFLKAARWAITLLVIGLSIGTAHNLNAQALPHIDRAYHGVPTLFVDGKPFLVVGAQCDIWRSTRQDAKTIQFFDAFKEMHATTVGIGIPWSNIETAEGRYDFAFLDWFIDRARERGLRLGINLFNTNVCGKVQEGDDGSAFPVYTPKYILSQPQKYHRMKLPYPYKYAAGGPPMCPNDPATLQREVQYVTRVAEHLKQADARHTVVMLQLNNEFYYQQWEGARPDYGSATEKAVRCQCENCNALWNKAPARDGETFMFESFARYAKALSEAIYKTYPLPMYLNSPWWPAYLVPTFLDACPNIDMVGIDGVLTPREPGIFSDSQRSRNLPFAAENPTENSEVRLNLDVLPWYTIAGRPGIGNLLWECGPPHTIVDDPICKQRYGAALGPIRDAMFPLCVYRGTEAMAAWFALREIPGGLKTDEPGNFQDVSGVKSRFMVRQAASSKTVEPADLEVSVGGHTFKPAASTAGALIQIAPNQVLLVTSAGTLHIGDRPRAAERGHYEGTTWVREESVAVIAEASGYSIAVSKPGAIRMLWQ